MRIIETERLILRTWGNADFQPMAKINQDKKVMRYFPEVQSQEQTKALIGKITEMFNQRGYTFYATELKESGVFVGMIGLGYVDFDVPFAPAVEIGWRLSSEHWRKGYATEGAKAVLKHGFENLDIKEIVSFTSEINIPSQGVMEKIGMHRDKHGDFEHPSVPEGSPLRNHVLYRLHRDSYFGHK